ncbi:hypothetical protein SOVF_106550 [Spinacia oleracea]|nr:hypothetical protein SOVF_106550 [Spinacia oleracea]
MIPFKSKKPLLTTPVKKNNNSNLAAVATPERANPNPSTRIRKQNFALSISDVRRTALQLQKSNNAGSDLPKVVPEKVIGSGIGQKLKGSAKPSASLPQKYEMLCEFFNAMVSSIRLLRLKRQQSTLTKLAKSIESLTDRRFTLHHLAQLKYLMPQVIVAKKIRVQDEETKCMKEELLVSLEVVVVETDKNVKGGGGGGFSQLKEIFRSQIMDFYKTQHEDADVPEGELPHLFYQPKQEPEENMNKTTPATLAASLSAPSFKRRFSSMANKPSSSFSETFTKETTSVEANATLCDFASTPAKLASIPPSSSFSETFIKEITSVEANATLFDFASTPAKLASIPAELISTPAELASTPADLASTPARLMAATPTLRPPKRSLFCDSPNKSSKRSKSLKFVENSIDIEEDQFSQVNPTQSSIISKDDVLEILPEGLLQSLLEKERKSIEEKDPVFVQAKRRQQLIASVPKLFDMILLLFKSINRSVITKEELIYKLLSGHLEIVDRAEIEEQLNLLQQLAPEYISEQLSISGDTLLRLNKSSCHESIRNKLFEAK